MSIERQGPRKEVKKISQEALDNYKKLLKDMGVGEEGIIKNVGPLSEISGKRLTEFEEVFPPVFEKLKITEPKSPRPEETGVIFEHRVIN